MKIINGVLACVFVLLLVVSTTAKSEVKVSNSKDKYCSLVSYEFISKDSKIYDSVEFDTTMETTALSHLDRTLPVQVIYEIERCSLSRDNSINSLPLPDMPEDGDTRTVIQERGNVRTEYDQIYIGGWVTIAIRRTLITPPVVTPPPETIDN